MKTPSLIQGISTLLLVLALGSWAFAQPPPPNFVNPDQADLLVVVHQALRTPDWYPGMEDAWETELLWQKYYQGLRVGLYEVADNVRQSAIRQQILQRAPNVPFVLIIGDARRRSLSHLSQVVASNTRCYGLVHNGGGCRGS